MVPEAPEVISSAKSLEKQGLKTSEWKEACHPVNGSSFLSERALWKIPRQGR
jgi:hypothetical protein